ncbi:UNVERIFIED_CONTAM: hypothetical protein HDU68_003359 [Siphonaria sp. JEL0065]|nr:hypothetical protein HDU68_003359 [Siphonaria sp. JEL0065]
MSVSMSHISDAVDLPDHMEAHRLRRQQKEELHNKVLLDGARMGMVISAGAIAASLISLVLAATTAGFFTETDRAALRADREFSQKFSISRSNESGFDTPDTLSEAKSWDMQTVKQVAYKNRFTLLSYAYVGIVGCTLAYNFSRKDIFMTQKFVNARLVGQFSAVAGILLIGAAAVGNKPETKVDAYYERIVNGDSKSAAAH